MTHRSPVPAPVRLLAAGAILALATTACGSEAGAGDDGGGGSEPAGWQTIESDTVEVGLPEQFEETPEGELEPETSAEAQWLDEDGIIIGRLLVHDDFATGVESADDAGAAAAGVIESDGTQVDYPREDISPEGTEGAQVLTFAYDAQGSPDGEPDDTAFVGRAVAGVDDDGTDFLVRLDVVEGEMSADEIQQVVDSIRGLTA
jgi:hypothetical protein